MRAFAKRYRQRLRDETGTAIMEFAALGALMLLPMVYVMLAVFDVQKAAYAVAAAAREGSRAYTLGDSEANATARMNTAIGSALKDQHVPVGDVSITKTCIKACLTADSSVRVHVQYQVPIPFVPDVFGGRPAASIKVESTHITPFGQFREDAR